VENVNKLYYIVGVEPLSLHAALCGYLKGGPRAKNFGDMCLFHGKNSEEQQKAVMENADYWNTHWLSCAKAELAEESNLDSETVNRLVDSKYQKEARQALGLSTDELPTELKIFGGHSYVALVVVKDDDEELLKDS